MGYQIYMAPRRSPNRLTLQAQRHVFESILSDMYQRSRKSANARTLEQALEGKPDGVIQVELPVSIAHAILETAGINY
jgi:uncharacterized protein (DUF2336 family)